MKIKEGGFSNPPLHSNPFKGLGNHFFGRGNWHDFNPVEFDGNAHTCDQRIVAAGMRQLGRINVKANSGEFATIASKAALNIINHSLSTIAKGPSRAQSVSSWYQVTAPVGEYVTRLLLLLADRGALSNANILEAFSLKSRRRLRDTYIDPSLADGLVEPTSRLQKYRLTEKGRRLLEHLGKEGGLS